MTVRRSTGTVGAARANAQQRQRMRPEARVGSEGIRLWWRFLDLIEAAAERWRRGPLRAATPYMLLVPGVVVLGVLAGALVHLLDESFRVLDVATYTMSDYHTLDSYRQVFSRPFFWVVFQRSLVGAAIVTFLTLLLAFPYAYVMVRTRSSVARRLLVFSLFLPFFIGQVVRAYGWLIILGQEGMANALLGWLGLEKLRMLYNFPAVVVGLVQYMLPFAVLVMAPAIVAIDEDIERASEGLGATWRRTFWHLVLPLARPGLVAAAIVVFTITLTDFAMPAIMGGGKADFMANVIYAAFFNMADSGLGSALSVLLVLIGSTIFAIFLLLVGVNGTRRALR